MGPMITFLLSIGLHLDWVTPAQIDTFPRPTLWALRSPVVYKGVDVTLMCQGQLGTDRIQLWMDGELKEERNASLMSSEFLLGNVTDLRDARSYQCRSGQKSLWSELSDSLTLVVMTGAFPQPTIDVTHVSPIPQGTTVTIRCQVPLQAPPQDYSFTLLQAKSLEPLQTQSPEGPQANFSLMSVSPENTGSYSCIYYKKTVPHSGSYPSQTLALTVTGKFPKPTLWVQPGLVIPQGSNITLWCSRPKFTVLGEVIFTLWKAGTQKFFQQQSSADLWTSFILSSVKPEDTGSYSCYYKERSSSTGGSEPSDALELKVLGSLPRPSLSAHPALVVKSGTHVTLQCRRPPLTFLGDVTFSLLKAGAPLPLQEQSPVGTTADFPLFSVRAGDTGIYSCAYYVRMTSNQVSEASDVMEIWVTDALPKPSLSAWPGSEVTSGASVTLLCQGPSWVNGFLLYKDGNKKILPSVDISHDGVKFFLTPVAPEHSGNYSCSYQLSTKETAWTLHSDPLQVMVRGSMPYNILIITLSCISFFLLLLCLLLWIFLCRASIPTEYLQGDRPKRSLCCPCLPHHPEALNSEVAKKRSRSPLIPMTEDPQGVTYTELRKTTFKKRKIDQKKIPTEPILYATVSLK